MAVKAKDSTAAKATKSRAKELATTTETRVETRGRKKGHAPSNPKGSPLMGEGYIGPPDQKQQLISRLLTETLRTYNLPKVKSDEELAERLGAFFRHCAETGERPTVEQMCQCTGYTIQKVWEWEVGIHRGFSPRTSEIIKNAKEFLRVFDAKMVAEGALNPVVYIFRAKNYYGMKDQQDLTIAPAQPMGAIPDEKQLAADYLKALPAADSE